MRNDPRRWGDGPETANGLSYPTRAPSFREAASVGGLVVFKPCLFFSLCARLRPVSCGNRGVSRPPYGSWFSVERGEEKQNRNDDQVDPKIEHVWSRSFRVRPIV